MRIRRIEVKDFRKLGHAHVEDLQDGLNVLVGDNEAGKSTLLAALRTGLFERHRVGGKVAAAMQPYGQTVRPEIAVDFEIDGGLWHLRKAFCQRPEAELRGPGERTSGDAVEERLAHLFGFTPPGAGGSKPEEHQGVHGLLWVEQGRSHRALGIGGGRDVIASALEQEVGQVVGGERGRALLTTAEERRNVFWDKRGNVRGDLKALGDEVHALRSRHAELAAALLAQDDKVAQLTGKSDALARHERDGRLVQAVRALEAARESVAGSQRLQSVHAAAAELLARRRLEHAGAAARNAARSKLVGDAGRMNAQELTSTTALMEEREALSRCQAGLKRAQQVLDDARMAARQAAAVVKAQEIARGRNQSLGLLTALRERVKAAQALDKTRRDRAASVSAITVNQDDIAALERLEADRDRAAFQLEAASVRFTFEPDLGRMVLVDGLQHDGAMPLLLSRDATLSLEGFGHVSIRPGGGVDALVRKAEVAVVALTDKRVGMRYPDAATAKAALAAKLEATRDMQSAQQTLKTLAPNGLEELLRLMSEQEASVRVAKEDGPEWSPSALDEALRALATAIDLERDAEHALEVERTARDAADRVVAASSERVAGIIREASALMQALERAQGDVLGETLLEQVRGAERDLTEAAEREAAAADALAASDPEAVALELKRAEGAERAIRADIEMLKRDRRDLEIELRAFGRQGLGEDMAEVEGRLYAEERRLDAQGVQARAARLLHDTLAQAQRETRDRWLGPVRERAAPYLRLVQPDSDIVLNEGTLEIESLVRKGVSEPFGGLSVGAREQVAVITRLALADILRGANRPSAIILDDALVNTDEDRLHRMHLVLQRAAQTMQILVLTCRERDFIQLGAPIRRLR